MFTKKLVLVTIILLGLVTVVYAVQDQEHIESTPSKFMYRKLDYSRDVVEGLATENFQQITKAAQDLMLLSHEADWNVITSPEYLKMSSEFRETTSRLRESGRKKNLDGATLAYFEVTLNCVRCHQHIRKAPIKN